MTRKEKPRALKSVKCRNIRVILNIQSLSQNVCVWKKIYIIKRNGTYTLSLNV